FLHPVIASLGLYKEPIEAYYGAPQSAASHAFAHRGAEVGFFLEAAPLYLALTSTAAPGFGAVHRKIMEAAARTTMHLGLAIDGFHEDVRGGAVKLRSSGAPVLDYVIPRAIWTAFREAQKRLAEAAFATGALSVTTLHDPPLTLSGPNELSRID